MVNIENTNHEKTLVATESFEQELPEKRRFYYFLYLFAFLILIYAIQDFQTSRNVTGTIGSRGGVHATLLTILVLLSLYYLYSILLFGLSISPVQITLWGIFLWIAIVNLIQGGDEWIMAIHLGLSCLWILSHHFFSSYLRHWKEALPQVLVIVTLLFFFYTFSALYATQSLHSYLMRRGKDEIAVVNLVYSVIVFFPWVALMKNRWVRMLGTGLILLVVAVSMKRGAIVVVPLMWSAYLFVEAIVNKQGLIRPFAGALFFILIFGSGMIVADLSSDGFLSKRFSSKELASGSGRTEAWIAGFEEISKRPFVDLVFGYGSGGSLKFFGTGAHNEWLEFIFNFGVFGGVLYALFLLSIFLQGLKLIINSSPYAPTYMMAFVYVSVVGVFSGVYFVHHTFYIFALLGTIEGLQLGDSKALDI